MIDWIIESILFILIWVTFYLASTIEISKSLIYIPKGSISHIVSHLSKESGDVIRLDRWLVRLIGFPQHGWVTLDALKQSRLDFYYQLTTKKAALQAVTIIPGETTVIALEMLAQQLSLDTKKLIQTYHMSPHPLKEARFVAQTYHIPIGSDEAGLIYYLGVKSDALYQKWKQRLNIETIGDKAFKKLLIKASIIQKEAASIDEMPIVASVIENRLKRHMPLEMDGTLNYGRYSHIKITPKRIKEDTSRYNTYKYRSLPEEPVCMISFEALNAALHPAKTDYLYFMRNRTGVHTFTKSYHQHLRVIKSVKK